MRKFLRRWLGVQDRGEVEVIALKAIEGAIRDVLTKDRYDSLWADELTRVKRRIDTTIRVSISEKVRAIVDAEVKGVVDHEEFIDEVIERIKRKQLT